ncbi:hypothetical protein FOZ60_015111 [Perkinsus olseni]|uniref:ethanolamine-phosphate cytidylyltransferase n=6 Tax=Perkinsus olseni TaxID=32597 RepID=A0A7J6P7E1_PEROL|nr:hypothetical protein FOZ60_015111 [Perkinsus olseni]
MVETNHIGNSAEGSGPLLRSPRTMRILICGCWDLMHTGHFNAIRQVSTIAHEIEKEKQLEGETVHVEVVAGIHPNKEIRRVKGGEFVCSEEEKETMLRACKWVDDIVHDVPYKPLTVEFLDKHRIDYAVHGDDIAKASDGTDMYGYVKEAGRYREFRRSECISTTTLINRILGCHPGANANEAFSLTSRRMSEFSRGNKPIENATKIVYISAVWDLLHTSHVEALRLAMEAVKGADYLLVGVRHDSSAKGETDSTVTSDGERALSLLSCRYVSDVILQAPERPSADFFRAFNISAVVVITNHPDFDPDESKFENAKGQAEIVKLTLPKGCVCTEELCQRVLVKRGAFEARNSKKVDPGVRMVTSNAQLRA